MVLEILLICLILAVLFALIKKPSHTFDIMCKNDTAFIKALAILMIVLSHIAVQLGGGGGYTYRIVGSWGAIGVAVFFFLSGYGNYYSIKHCIAREGELSPFWLIKKIVRLIIVFILCFTVASLIVELSMPEKYTLSGHFMNLLTLRMPGSSTWYLKVQILMYGILWMSGRFGKSKSSQITTVLSVVYTLVAALILKLPDFWWKTAMCFPAGVLLAKYKEQIESSFGSRKILKFMGIIATAFLAYGYLLFTSAYLVLPQSIAYIFIVIGICTVTTVVTPRQTLLNKISSFTLELYLIHIGILTVFVQPGAAVWRTFLYVAISIVLAWLINVCTKRIIRR